MPVVVLQLAVGFLFLQRHFEDATRQMTENRSRDLALVRRVPSLGEELEIEVAGGRVVDRWRLWDLSGAAVAAELGERFDDLVAVDLVSRRKFVQAAFGDGTVLTFERRTVTPANPHQLLVWMILVGILASLVSILFMRGQIRPIRRLARAAQAFGHGETVAYSPAGATEVRAAGMAFLDMRARIDRHIEQRTLLLSGVSHDLRTPLTRMRLSLAMLEG